MHWSVACIAFAGLALISQLNSDLLDGTWVTHVHFKQGCLDLALGCQLQANSPSPAIKLLQRGAWQAAAEPLEEPSAPPRNSMIASFCLACGIVHQ
jgi:hypothetical protein